MVCTWRSEDGSVGQFSPSLLRGLCQLDSGLQICVKTLYSLGHPIGPYILNLLVCVCLSVCARAHGCECGCECLCMCVKQKGTLNALLCGFSLVPLEPNLSLNLELIFSWLAQKPANPSHPPVSHLPWTWGCRHSQYAWVVTCVTGPQVWFS